MIKLLNCHNLGRCNILAEEQLKLGQLELKFRQIQQKNINCTRSVLFEMNEDGYISGLTDNYIRVKVSHDKPVKSNFISNVRLLDINDGIMLGEIAQ